MSGSGLIAAPVAPRRTDACERADLLAYLRRKRANAETMAEKSVEFADQGRWTARQIAILEQDIATGLHVGEADKPDPAEWR